ncbi:hypothetical protein DFQ27_003499 [Actinomortierella ambigua]|uniref:Protein kinase domain-containing protein n=1 Tax=Actinomortierella ambigua TaxID=1343610 RepID=A0A9P6Q7B0_9FUNG|nr:hypothetical protein DFQ27_003499 [Actinomortierella ambigua]
MSLKLGKCVGEGGFGAVYIGMWHGQRCAVKKFHLRGQDKLIQQEIAHVKNLRHRHIILFLATETYEGSLVMITDFAEGGTLQSAILDRRLGDGWVKKDEIAKEIAKGLAYIHSNKIIHRDLKSGNVLLTRHLEVKLCDFGLAQVKINTASSHTSNQASAAGTLRWMAPELLTLRPKYSTKSDTYALGMVMWEMAADCTVPFQEQGDNSIIADLVRKGEREDIPEETPADYKSWIERCWEQDPSKRPEAAEMLDENMDDVGYASGSQASMVSLTTSMSNLSTSTERSRAPGSGSSSGSIKLTARPGLSARLAARLSTLEGEYAERVTEMLSLFDGTMYVIPSRIVEELELMVTPVDQLLDDAKHGDAGAQYKLGRKYLQALGVEPDFEEGTRLLAQAADQGHAEALFRRALAMALRPGTPSDAEIDMVEGWLQRSSDDGHVLANTLLFIARQTKQSKDGEFSAEATKVLEAREVGGDGIASLFLGFPSFEKDDYGKAAHYMQRATMRGQVEGEMHREGRGVSRDELKAATLFRRAAAQGDSNSKKALRDIKM